MKIFSSWMLLLGVGFLAGCAYKPPVEPSPVAVSNPDQTFREYELFWQKHSCWTISGKLGFSDGKQSQSLSFDWDQSPDHYHLQFYGPLGIKLGELESQKVGVIWKEGNISIAAKTPESLIEKAMGVSFPVEDLSFWIRGLPAGNEDPHRLLNFGRFQSLNEDGWNVHYLSYEKQAKEWMPERLSLSHLNYRMVVYVKEIEYRCE